MKNNRKECSILRQRDKLRERDSTKNKSSQIREEIREFNSFRTLKRKEIELINDVLVSSFHQSSPVLINLERIEFIRANGKGTEIT